MYQDYMMYGLVPNNNYYERRVEDFRNSKRVSQMDEVLEIIVKSIQDEKEDEMFYEFLISSTARKEDKDIITSIRDDERKHRNLLKEVYRSLTGKEFVYTDTNNNPDEIKNITYMQGLENAFMGELKAFEKYRRALSRITDRENYNKIFEIMTDEMKHSIKYNYLITKNLR